MPLNPALGQLRPNGHGGGDCALYQHRPLSSTSFLHQVVIVMGLSLLGSLTSVACLVAVMIYRAYFHPLSHIPGPCLASITSLYQFYRNRLHKDSSFYLQMEKLHSHYGPVVRISPHQVHLQDPAHHQTIHRAGTKFTKDPAYYRTSFVSSLSMFTTQDNALRRARRSVLAPLFTRARALELEHIVQHKVSKLCKRMQELLASSQPVDIHHTVRCISLDTMTEYAFDNCRTLLDTPDFAATALDAVKQGQLRLWELPQFPWIVKLRQAPRWILKIVSPATAVFMARRALIDAQVFDVQRRVAAGEEPADDRRTVFHRLLDPSAAGGHGVLPIEAMTDEAGILVAAAGETVGLALTMAFYRVLASDQVRRKLLTELQTVFPDRNVELKFAELEKLPYLTAVLKESLCLSFPLPGRPPRVIPDGGAHFNGYHLPAGLAVSMSQWVQHRNETVFPDPMAFEPERWLSSTAKGNGGPEDYLIVFGRGSRVCLGVTLAWCELYKPLGTVMRRFGDRIDLYDSIGERDFYPGDDYVTFWPRNNAKKLAVIGKPESA